jgi:lipopolysaccharide transport system permease protein
MAMGFGRSIWRNRQLWWRLAEREVLGRYKGSILGVGWSYLQPLMMLAVYTFIFSEVFKSRWGPAATDHTPLVFAINLFAGLIVFNFFSECLVRAPSLVLSNPNYVKKVVFPLDILAPVSIGNAGFHAMCSLSILALFELVAFGSIPRSAIWLPLVWMPLILGCLAISWLLASIGVFLRDIGQLVTVFVNMLMFLSPIFFPLSALPKTWRPWLGLNPLSSIIEQTRGVLIEGNQPSILYLIIGTGSGIVACELAHRFFERSKSAFADVL